MKSSKGISPLIAAVLLIAFTVSISMIVMGWFGTFTRTTTTNITETSKTAVSCATASIEIDHVYVDNTANITKFVVENTGQVNLTVNALIVNTTGGMCINNSDTPVGAGKMATISMSNCTGITNTTFSKALVTTSCPGITDEVTLLSYVKFT